MARIESEEVRKYLERIQSIKQGLALYDCHVHPFESLFCENQEGAGEGRGASAAECALPLPEPGEITDPPEDECSGTPARFKRASQVLSLRSNFRYASPAGFCSHMRTAGLDVSLLLPIAPASGEMECTLSLLSTLFGRDERFLVGCSVPNSVAPASVGAFLWKMKSAHRMKAVKLHHNISEIDLSASWGKERTEAILEACAGNRLPLIVHGGRSMAQRNPNARSYACIAAMKDIDWTRNGNTVVLAHAGAYECSTQEVDQDILPTLERMLSRHANLFIDLSGLSCEVQARILTRVGTERIVFGSDALYNSPWKEAAKLVHSLGMAGMKVDESFIRIAHQNPERVLFKRTVSHVRGSAHQAMSAHGGVQG